jgi:hypothetical protein
MAACSSAAPKPSNTRCSRTDHHPETIVELSREIELDMARKLASPAASLGSGGAG